MRIYLEPIRITATFPLQVAVILLELFWTGGAANQAALAAKIE